MTSPCHACQLPPEACRDCAYLAGTCCGGYADHHDTPAPIPAPAVQDNASTTWTPSPYYSGIVVPAIVPQAASGTVIYRTTARRSPSAREELKKKIRAVIYAYERENWATWRTTNAVDRMLALFPPEMFRRRKAGA